MTPVRRIPQKADNPKSTKSSPQKSQKSSSTASTSGSCKEGSPVPRSVLRRLSNIKLDDIPTSPVSNCTATTLPLPGLGSDAGDGSPPRTPFKKADFDVCKEDLSDVEMSLDDRLQERMGKIADDWNDMKHFNKSFAEPPSAEKKKYQDVEMHRWGWEKHGKTWKKSFTIAAPLHLSPASASPAKSLAKSLAKSPAKPAQPKGVALRPKPQPKKGAAALGKGPGPMKKPAKNVIKGGKVKGASAAKASKSASSSASPSPSTSTSKVATRVLKKPVAKSTSSSQPLKRPESRPRQVLFSPLARLSGPKPKATEMAAVKGQGIILRNDMLEANSEYRSLRQSLRSGDDSYHLFLGQHFISCERQIEVDSPYPWNMCYFAHGESGTGMDHGLPMA